MDWVSIGIVIAIVAIGAGVGYYRRAVLKKGPWTPP